MGLWDMGYGKIGAFLKIIEKHGVTENEIRCILQEVDGLGASVAAHIKLSIRKSTIVFEHYVQASDHSMVKLAAGCKFAIDISDELGEIGEQMAYSSQNRDVGVFRFRHFQFDGCEPTKRKDRIVTLMADLGYEPAPFRIFLGLLRTLHTQTDKRLLYFKGHPLACLDRFHGMTDYLAVDNRSFNYNTPKLQMGSFDLDGKLGVSPSEFHYLGMKKIE